MNRQFEKDEWSLLLLDFFNQTSSKFKNEIHLRDNLYSAIQLSMTLENGTYLLDLYGAKKDSVLLVKKPWGVFNCVVVQGFRNQRRLKKTAFPLLCSLQTTDFPSFLHFLLLGMIVFTGLIFVFVV